jgi:hypothetical protein
MHVVSSVLAATSVVKPMNTLIPGTGRLGGGVSEWWGRTSIPDYYKMRPPGESCPWYVQFPFSAYLIILTQVLALAWTLVELTWISGQLS